MSSKFKNYCSSCGFKLVEGQKFCGRCGKKVYDSDESDFALTAKTNYKKKKERFPYEIVLLFLLTSSLIVGYVVSDRLHSLFSRISTKHRLSINENPQVQISPLNYLTRDNGDGWNVGFVRMYFFIPPNLDPPHITNYSTSLLEATVETAQGKTYPVSILKFSSTADINQYLGIFTRRYGPGNIVDIGWPQNIQIQKLVPGLPMVPFEDDNDQYVLSFLYSKATNPTSLNLSTSDGVYTFDLGSVSNALPLPSPNYEKINAFQDIFYQDNNSVIFRFDDKCFYDQNGHYYIHYYIKNKDIYDSLVYEIPGTYFLYRENGTIFSFDFKSNVISVPVGPGQEVNGKFDITYFSSKNKPLFFIYENGSSLKVFRLSCILVQ